MRVLFGLVLGAVVSGTPPAPPTVEQLIRDLSSRKFSEREAATRRLESLGAEALAPLRKALREGDLETRRRVERILPALEARVEAARLLAPTRVRLRYDAVPLADALADFARRSGFPLHFDDETPPPKRKITLDTGATTFWDALARFCAAAGVSERSALLAAGVLASGEEESPGPLALADGRTRPLPVHLAGALRLRAFPLPPGPPASGFLLRVDAEPGVPLRGVVRVRVERAIDAAGRVVKLPEPYDHAEAPAADGPARWDALTGLPTRGPAPDAAPLRWSGKGMPVLLKEVAGVATVQLEGRRPLITVENILQAAGREVPGVRGGWVKVTEVARAGERLRLTVRLRAEQADPGAAGFEVRRARNGVLVMRGGVPDAADLVLEGPGGAPIKPLSAERSLLTREAASGMVVEFTLEYPLPAGQGGALTLFYTGPRLIPVEVPFVLRDVPLSSAPQRGTAAPAVNPYLPAAPN